MGRSDEKMKLKFILILMLTIILIIIPVYATPQVKYQPSSFSVDTGTLDAGNLASLLSIDGDTVDVSELVGVPGYDIRANFTGVNRFTSLNMVEMYDGNAGHNVDIQIYNNTGAKWETVGDIVDSVAFNTHNITIESSDDFINNGTVWTRIYHITNGNGAHDQFVDYISLVSNNTDVDTGELEILKCPDDTPAALILIFLATLSIVLFFAGISYRIKAISVLGSLMIIIMALYVSPCAHLIGIAFAGFGFIALMVTVLSS